MEAFLRKNLQNNEISLSFHLSKQEAVQRNYSKQEYLLEMEKMNLMLTTFIKEFELEFD